MISTSHKNKFIFIGINKTATTSIRKILRKYGGKGKHTHFLNGTCGEHKPHKKNKSKCPYDNQHIVNPNTLNLDDFFKFVIVRNPWDRLVSLYNWGTQIKGGKHWNFSFKKFIMSLHTEENPLKEYKNIYLPSKPMLEWVTNENGEVLVDFVGKFETLEKDWEYISKQLQIKDKLPHLYKTKRSHYRDYYDEEMVERINEIYKKDIEHFNYKF